MYWKTKFFRTYRNMSNWINQNKDKYQINQLFINNAYGVEYKPLIIIDC